MRDENSNSRGLHLLSLVLVVLMVVAAGCGEPEGAEAGAGDPNANGSTEKQDKDREDKDLEHAKELWDQIKNYSSWNQPEGFEGWDDGVSPHGSVLRYYVNDTAEEDLTQDGAVIVKENYSERSEDALMSVTVMEKTEGYDPETENWFYVKYSPEGEVMKDEQGKPLAGLVGKGKDKGCVPCHSTAGGGDYLFMNDE